MPTGADRMADSVDLDCSRDLERLLEAAGRELRLLVRVVPGAGPERVAARGAREVERERHDGAGPRPGADHS